MPLLEYTVTNKVAKLTSVYMDTIPENLEPGVLYISHRFKTAIHLCACGCGKQVVTPFSKGEWKLRESRNSASIYPSIGNWDFPCQSHYWIRNSKIIWAGRLSRDYIEAARKWDRERLEKLYCDRKKTNVFKRFLDRWFTKSDI
jgi:hypothetical protein